MNLYIYMLIFYFISVSEETTRRDKILYSDTNESYDVVKDTTREEVPLQSIHLEHNLAYDKTKPSIKQQPVPVVYDTPLLMPQQKQLKPTSQYDEINDFI